MKEMSKRSKQIIVLILLIVCIILGLLFDSQDKSDKLVQDISYFDIDSIPEYTDKIYITLNDNIPYFKECDYTNEPFEIYSKLDNLGRCRSCLCKYLQRDNA